jgi:hypothetical protein
MWPVFGILAIVFWWLLIHTDYDTVGLKGMRAQQSDSVIAQGPHGMATSPGPASVVPEVPLNAAADDPELASYNARLAELAAKGPKTWRHREEVVVRRPQ